MQTVSGVTTTATNIDDDDDEIRLNGMLDKLLSMTFYV
jgi:hypothetical protein